MEPRTQEEYERLHFRNMRVTGIGIQNVTNHFPCPFCAAEDWWVVPLIDMTAPPEPGRYATAPTACAACKRSARTIMERTEDGGLLVSMEQVDGADPPPWISIGRGRLEDE